MQIKRKQTSPGHLICKLLGAYSGWIFGMVLLVMLLGLLTQSTDVRERELNTVAHQLRIPMKEEEAAVAVVAASGGDGAKPIVIPGTDLLCPEAKRKVVDKEWPDPNQGKVWARETITYPHFYITLHAQEYDPVRWRIMEEGKYYETEVHERFVQILDGVPSSYVLDVGANIGYYTLLSASLGHKVISFEPNPANVLRLCDSLRLNDFLDTPEIHIFQNAVSNVHGEEMMLYSPRNPGQAFLKPIEGADEETNDHKAKTTVVMLDKVAEDQGWLTRPDFKIKLMKVDVEGKEPQVFIGAPKLLSSGIVENILAEGRRFGRVNIIQSFEVLFESGYTIKEPAIPIPSGITPQKKAKIVSEWYLDKLGSNSMVCRDMWWVRADAL
jgi:FkbM family methyltransferase